MDIIRYMMPLCIIGACCAPLLNGSHGDRCLFSPNPYLKRSVADDLLLTIKNGYDDGKTAAMILPLLQKKIPLIKRFAIKRDMFGRSIVELTLEQPWVLLLCEGNYPLVLARTGAAASAHLIRDDVIGSLAPITMARGTNTPDQIRLLVAWLRQQPEMFFGRFSVLWRDKSDIEIHDEAMPTVPIRATIETIFNNCVLKFLDTMIEKSKSYATIDLRFGDEQIILVPKVSRGKRG